METIISSNAIWLLDALADGITIQDPTGRLVYANPAAVSAAGFASAQEMIDTPTADILRRFVLLDEYGQRLPVEELPGRRALDGSPEEERTIQFRIIATDQVRWTIVKARPVLNPDSTVRYAINIWHDVTESMERQRALEYATAQLEETTAQLEITVSVLELRTAEAEERAERQRFLSEAGRMLASSLETEETLRMIAHLAVPRIADWATISLIDAEGILQPLEVAHDDPDKLRIVREMQQNYPPDSSHVRGPSRVARIGEAELYPEIPDGLLEAMARDQEHLGLLHTLQLRSAMVVPMKVRDQVLGVITFIRAQSDRRNYDAEDLEFAESLASRAALALSNARLYRDAHEGNRAKADFLAVMSHELRTPLTAIFGYTELLSTGVAGPITDAQKTHLERIHASAAHLLAIIEDILGYARAEAGRDQLHASLVKLAQVASEAIVVVKPVAEKKNLALEWNVDEAIVMQTDHAKLRQILINLLGNAVKFTESGYVRLRGRREPGDMVKIEVADSGPGIPAEDFARIFEPFRQLQPSMTRSTGGTGLGLAVSRRFAELLGGRIEVHSRAGGGSLFTVTLPLVSHP